MENSANPFENLSLTDRVDNLKQLGRHLLRTSASISSHLEGPSLCTSRSCIRTGAAPEVVQRERLCELLSEQVKALESEAERHITFFIQLKQRLSDLDQPLAALRVAAPVPAAEPTPGNSSAPDQSQSPAQLTQKINEVLDWLDTNAPASGTGSDSANHDESESDDDGTPTPTWFSGGQSSSSTLPTPTPPPRRYETVAYGQLPLSILGGGVDLIESVNRQRQNFEDQAQQPTTNSRRPSSIWEEEERLHEQALAATLAPTYGYRPGGIAYVGFANGHSHNPTPLRTGTSQTQPTSISERPMAYARRSAADEARIVTSAPDSRSGTGSATGSRNPRIAAAAAAIIRRGRYPSDSRNGYGGDAAANKRSK